MTQINIPGQASVPMAGTLAYSVRPRWLRNDDLNTQERQDRLAALLRTLMECHTEAQPGGGGPTRATVVSELTVSAVDGVRIVLMFSDGHETYALRRLAELLERCEAVERLGGVVASTN